MKSFILILVCCLSFGFAQAQDGYVNIQKDGRVDELLDLYSRHHNSFDEKPGYRLQIIASTNRERAYKAQSDFRYRYGQFKTYLTYKSPYFKLRACNFTDKLEAYRFLQKVKGKFPGAFLVEEPVSVR